MTGFKIRSGKASAYGSFPNILIPVSDDKWVVSSLVNTKIL
jgi:hypothetical protein